VIASLNGTGAGEYPAPVLVLFSARVYLLRQIAA
jgi:hypothetical protein